MKTLNRMVFACFAALLSACAIGCCNGEMKSFDINVALHDSLKDVRGVLPAVEVDVVAVNSADLPTWEQKSMTDYFSPGDSLRASADNTSSASAKITTRKRSPRTALPARSCGMIGRSRGR